MENNNMVHIQATLVINGNQFSFDQMGEINQINAAYIEWVIKVKEWTGATTN